MDRQGQREFFCNTQQCVILTPQPARQFIILINTCAHLCTKLPCSHKHTVVSLTFCRVVEETENQVVAVCKSTSRSKQLMLSHSSFSNKQMTNVSAKMSWRRLCWSTSCNSCRNVVTFAILDNLTWIKCERQFSLDKVWLIELNEIQNRKKSLCNYT